MCNKKGRISPKLSLGHDGPCHDTIDGVVVGCLTFLLSLFFVLVKLIKNIKVCKLQINDSSGYNVIRVRKKYGGNNLYLVWTLPHTLRET